MQPNDEIRARLAAIVDSSDDAIVSKTLDGVITSWNRGAERIFGYTAAEAVGQHIFLIIPDDRKAEEEDVLARLRRGERVDHFETVRQAKDGRRLPISLTVSPIRNAEGTVVGASKVARDISDRKTAERAQLLLRLALAQEDERRRIARELHDTLGQQLTALRLTLELLNTEAFHDRPEVRAQIETLQELARQLDSDVAFRVGELRPGALEDAGLGAALAKYVRSWSDHFGIRAQLHATTAIDNRLTRSVETVFYRVAQEALNNVARHARATQVDVALESNVDYVSLIVEDNGIGFDASNGAHGDRLGLIGMRERLMLVGGKLEIESSAGQGTTILARVPTFQPVPVSEPA
jgi:PAS domain S-box-containing protein